MADAPPVLALVLPDPGRFLCHYGADRRLAVRAKLGRNESAFGDAEFGIVACGIGVQEHIDRLLFASRVLQFDGPMISGALRPRTDGALRISRAQAVADFLHRQMSCDDELSGEAHDGVMPL